MNYNQYAFGWRDYDPKIGRWHVKDPLYFLHYDLNPYNFVENNPINNIDLHDLDVYYMYNNGPIKGIKRSGPDVCFNTQSGGITGEDITGSGWPCEGYNLPGTGESGKRRISPKKKSKSSTAEKVAGVAGLANGTKSTILETTELVAKKAGEKLGEAFSKYLAALKVVNALGYGIAMYERRY